MKFNFKKNSENKNRLEIKNTTGNLLECATNCEKEFRCDNCDSSLTVYGKLLR